MIAPDNTAFVLISFEGPDAYSNAGGLGVRMAELSAALGEDGYETQLHFVGDPDAAFSETAGPNRTLYRWCQPLSQHFRGGVYQGENEKIGDFNSILPMKLAEELIPELLTRNERVALLAEEWHTADTIGLIHDRLWFRGLRDHTIHFWNANATFGLERINWWRMYFTKTYITTVSRYMKQMLWNTGVDPLVIPNGIPKRMLEKVPQKDAQSVRKSIDCETLLVKVGRWDPNKRWQMAVEAVAQAKSAGLAPTLVVRGGVEPHQAEVLERARQLGLKVMDVWLDAEVSANYDECLQAISKAEAADILVLRFIVPERLLRALYYASDAVLANSGREPFGIVGLEVMAAGGVAFTGSTGEGEYAKHLENAIVIDTSNPREIVHYLQELRRDSELGKAIRAAGKRTAERFTWNSIIRVLNSKLEMAAGLG